MSAIIAMFSSPVVRSARSACRRSCLATSATTGRLGVDQRADLRVVDRARPGLAGAAERGQLRVAEVQLLGGPLEELGVLGHRARPAALDEADAELVEQRRDGQLVGDGEVHPLLLGAVAQGRVVDLERRAGGDGHDGLSSVLGRTYSSVLAASSFCRRGCAGAVDGSRGGGGAPTNKKTPRGTGGLRVSWWADALLDNEGGAGHPCIVAHVTFRGHAFHPLDGRAGARSARRGCPIR